MLCYGLSHSHYQMSYDDVRISEGCEFDSDIIEFMLQAQICLNHTAFLSDTSMIEDPGRPVSPLIISVDEG